MTTGEAVATAARDLIGTAFRAQGRDPAFGIDCVGVVAVALTRAGVEASLPHRYALRSADVPDGAVPDALSQCDGAEPGDILLLRISPAQLHLAVRTARGIVHADVQARRVVERTGAPPWPIASAWRVTLKGE